MLILNLFILNLNINFNFVCTARIRNRKSNSILSKHTKSFKLENVRYEDKQAFYFFFVCVGGGVKNLEGGGDCNSPLEELK